VEEAHKSEAHLKRRSASKGASKMIWKTLHKKIVENPSEVLS
jgi:hypothetical protein